MTHSYDFTDSNKAYQLIIERFGKNPVADKKAFQDISTTVDINPELIKLILELYSNEEAFSVEKMQKFSIEEILRYLQATHRYYLNKKLPEIEQSIVHIFSNYGSSHQLLASLAYFFNDYKTKLIEHIRLEERDFFPYIQQLIAFSKGLPAKTNQAVDPALSISSFIDVHSPIEEQLEEVSQLIKQHSADKVIPLPYKIFLNQIDFFKLELRKHAIIEDHVLVPMALALEASVRSSQNKN